MRNLEEILSRLLKEKAETEAYLKGLNVAVEMTQAKLEKLEEDSKVAIGADGREFKL